MKLIRKNNKKGFTLVELIVVIAIIAILALILIPAITGYTKKADEAALQSSARALQTKANLHISEFGVNGKNTDTPPKTLQEVLTAEVGGKYGVSIASGASDESYTITVSHKGYKVDITPNGVGTVVPSP